MKSVISTLVFRDVAHVPQQFSSEHTRGVIPHIFPHIFPVPGNRLHGSRT